MVEKNLGKLDRIFRFLLAFWWLGPFAPQYPYLWASGLITVVGWIALIESFVGFCWLHKMFGIKNKEQ